MRSLKGLKVWLPQVPKCRGGGTCNFEILGDPTARHAHAADDRSVRRQERDTPCESHEAAIAAFEPLRFGARRQTSPIACVSA